MNHIHTILLQDNNSREVRTVAQAAMLDDTNPQLHRTNLDDLKHHSDLLRSGHCLPVGSVEFVRHAMHLANIKEPEPVGFPSNLKRFYGRDIQRTTAGAVKPGTFVKPVATKLFNGFVWTGDQPRDEDEAENQHQFLKVPPNTPVWVSEVVQWGQEFRFYINHKQIQGHGRYDPRDEPTITPSVRHVLEIVKTLQIHTPFSIDVGYLNGGDIALVEINDFWALGLYEDALTPKKYLKLLSDRWSGLVDAARPYRNSKASRGVF